ncbi:MAG: ABC transporter permease [Alphaproteobacteria bacterium]|nr:ABC transporter permease [Alphaproteobacteria bacterium]
MPAPPTPPPTPRAGRAFARLAASPLAVIGAGTISLWAVVALFAPYLAPFPPNALLQPFALPGTPFAEAGTFWLGTDQLGRDILSRLIWGARTVLFYAPLATACAYAVGITAGLAAGYLRGWIDELFSRLADLVLAFPVLILYILVIATVGASGLNIVIAITFASAPGIMRIVRGLTLDLRNRDYVVAAQTRGESTWYIALVEILPNARGPLIVDACLRLGYVTITIGVLGFLGLGLPPPDADWGGMINEARPVAFVFPHMTVFPCLALSSLVLACNLLADGLRTAAARG